MVLDVLEDVVMVGIGAGYCSGMTLMDVIVVEDTAALDVGVIRKL